MRSAHSGPVAVAAAVLLVLAAVAPVAGAVGDTRQERPTDAVEQEVSTASPAAVSTTDRTVTGQVDGEDDIRQTQRYALTPDTPGEIAVRLTYEIPDRVVSLQTHVPDNATGVDTDGFDRVNETAFEWDETTDAATISYRIDPNRTVETSGPEAAAGRYIAVDAGEWALVSRSQTPTQWRYTGEDPVGFRQTVTTDGPGAAGGQLVYLGPVTTFERSANGQTFRLVVPERAQLRESPEEILDSLTAAAGALQVGDRDAEVFVVAAPTDGVDWAVRGLETGKADIWVRDRERLDTPDNVWLHEYVHSRQSFSTTRSTRWLTEGTAVYYAAILTLEQERIDFAAFRDTLADAERDSYADVVLADPSTWERNANYVKGSLVTGRVDEEIRRQSDREATLQAVFRRANGIDRPLTQTRLLAAVERVGGSASRTEAAEYTESTAPVTMWNQSVHGTVFGQLPARIGYALPNETDGYRVSGPYRNGSLAEPAPIRLATGETLTVDAVVRNAGGTEGTYNASLDVNGTSVDTKRGRIGPGNETVVRLSHTFETAGRYAVSVDGDTVPVVVERPAETRVSGVTVSADRAVRGSSVVVTATVVNDAQVPADGTVVFTRDDEQVAQQRVTLLPGATTQVARSVALPNAGEVALAAGGSEPATVTVTTESATTTRTTGGNGAGFTVVVTLLALVVALVARGRR